MDLKKSLSFQIEGKPFLFRTLVEDDVTQSYVDALSRQRMFLENNPEGIDIRWQRRYVKNIRESKWDTICGLFSDSQLLGTSGIQNIKPGEPVTAGIFVLNSEDRGKGYGKLLVWSSCTIIHRLCGNEKFGAGAKKSNMASWKVFLSCGFQIAQEDHDIYKLALQIRDLKAAALLEQIVVE